MNDKKFGRIETYFKPHWYIKEWDILPILRISPSPDSDGLDITFGWLCLKFIFMIYRDYTLKHFDKKKQYEFLFFPKKLNGECKWLQWMCIHKEFRGIDGFGFLGQNINIQ